MNAEHVIFSNVDGAYYHCLHCDAQEHPKRQAPVAEFLKLADAFEAAHKDCPALVKSTMPDYAKLKQLAAAADKEGQHVYTSPRDSNNWEANRAFINEATADAVLEIIERMERAVDAMNSDTGQELSFKHQAFVAEEKCNELLAVMEKAAQEIEKHGAVNNSKYPALWLREAIAKVRGGDKSPYDQLVEACANDFRKLCAMPPYNTMSNCVAGDGIFANSIKAKYPDDVRKLARELLGLQPEVNNEQSC